ncbi:MAG: hypothetical protein HZB92_02815 [Euryarchaeota archaeon]|nr:hypothetical protein [Euryarchaeota archaeon]
MANSDYGNPIWEHMVRKERFKHYLLGPFVILLILSPLLYYFFSLTEGLYLYFLIITTAVGFIFLTAKFIFHIWYGPSIFENGFLPISRGWSPFYGKFIFFKDVKTIQVGFDEERSEDIEFAKKVTTEKERKHLKDDKELIEWVWDSIYIVTKDEKTHYLVQISEIDLERLLKILNMRNIKYTVSKDFLPMTDVEEQG